MRHPVCGGTVSLGVELPGNYYPFRRDKKLLIEITFVTKGTAKPMIQLYLNSTTLGTRN